MLSRIIEVGPLTIHIYGLVIAFAIYVAYWLSKKKAHLHQIPQKLFDDPILLIPLIISLIGARLYHVLDYWDIYKNNLWSVLNISAGGLGIFGVLGGFLLGLFIISKVKKLNFTSLLDLVSPSMLLAQAIGRFGNWVNQEAFGPPTNLPWGIYIQPENRPPQFSQSTHFHPTFFYEAVIDAVFFIVLLKLSKRFNKPGQVFALYLILYSIGRFTAEFFRIDTAQIESVKVAHVLTVVIFLLGLGLIFKKERL